MRFTHLAEFSEYAKYQPFKFYLLIFVIACFPVTYACGQTYICHNDADARRRLIHDLEIARAYRREDDAGVCQNHQPKERRGRESREWIVRLIRNRVRFRK